MVAQILHFDGKPFAQYESVQDAMNTNINDFAAKYSSIKAVQRVIALLDDREHSNQAKAISQMCRAALYHAALDHTMKIVHKNNMLKNSFDADQPRAAYVTLLGADIKAFANLEKVPVLAIHWNAAIAEVEFCSAQKRFLTAHSSVAPENVNGQLLLYPGSTVISSAFLKTFRGKYSRYVSLTTCFGSM